MNAQMATALCKLAEAGGRANLNELGLTRNQWDNFQKMRYFDLVEYGYKDDGSRDSGVWCITEPRGYKFLAGKIMIPKRVETYRGQRVKYIKTEYCSIISLSVEKWKQKGDYNADSTPHS